MVAFTRRKVPSSLAASLGAVAAGASQLGGAGTATAAGEMPGMDHDSAAGAAHSGDAGFARGGVVDSAANGFDPTLILRDFDWGRTRSCPTAARCASGSWSRATRRSRSAGRQVRRLDVQRARPRALRPGAARATGCGCASVTAALIRTRSTSTASTPRRWTACRAWAREIGAGLQPTRYEFDAGPFGPHLYHCHVLAAGRAHREGPLRRVHRRPKEPARRPTSS